MKNQIRRCVPFIFAFAVFIVADAFFSGCAKLQPGSDPLIVRAEQVETTAKASFDLVLRIDHADRGFWRTNAPGFHNFCEWLRHPQPVWGTNTLPRASAMIVSLDNVKLDYKDAQVGSNALITALITLQSVVDEASAWGSVVTNRNRSVH